MNDMADKQAKPGLGTADIVKVMQLLPHRYPFLMLDRIFDMDSDKSCVGVKNVTINEPFFQGHFPGHPVMPGVLVIEALAQTGGILTQLSHQSAATDKLFYLVKIDNAKFSKMVVPGVRLDLEVTLKRVIRNVAIYSGVASVNGEQVACAEIVCAEAKG
jgi:3-hydroxyacyl-[acyl-carrier-protein] dehydratase